MLYTAREYVQLAPDLDPDLDPIADGLTVEVSLARFPESPTSTWFAAEFVQDDAGDWRVRLLVGPGTAVGQLAQGAWWPVVRVLGLGARRPDYACPAFTIEGGPEYAGSAPVPPFDAVILRGQWLAGTPYPEQSLVLVGSVAYVAPADVPARALFVPGDWIRISPWPDFELPALVDGGVYAPGLSATIAIATQQLRVSQLIIPTDCTLTEVAFGVTTAGAAGATASCAIYKLDPATGSPGELVYYSPQSPADTLGTRLTTGLSVPLPRGIYFTGVRADGAGVSVNSNSTGIGQFGSALYPVSNHAGALALTSLSFLAGVTAYPPPAYFPANTLNSGGVGRVSIRVSVP